MKKIMSIIMLIAFTAQGVPNTVHAEDESIQFDPPIAGQLLGDLKYYDQHVKDLQDKIAREAKDKALADKQIELFKVKDAAQQEDILKLTKAKDDFEALYKKSDSSRLKCEADKPSRTTWALIGAGITAVLGAAVVIFAGN